MYIFKTVLKGFKKMTHFATVNDGFLLCLPVFYKSYQKNPLKIHVQSLFEKMSKLIKIKRMVNYKIINRNGLQNCYCQEFTEKCSCS